MSGLFKQYKTDKNAETKGVKITFEEAANDDGTIPAFFISRMGGSNRQYQAALEAKVRPYKRHMELGILKNEVAESLFLEVFCDTILTGWENVLDENNAGIPYSKPAALDLMKALPDVYSRLQEEAKLASNFREFQQEAQAKN